MDNKVKSTRIALVRKIVLRRHINAIRKKRKALLCQGRLDDNLILWYDIDILLEFIDLIEKERTF